MAATAQHTHRNGEEIRFTLKRTRYRKFYRELHQKFPDKHWWHTIIVESYH